METIDTIVTDTINNAVTIVTSTQEVHQNYDYFSLHNILHDPLYWIGAIILILTVLFIRKYIYWEDSDGNEKGINNFIVILVSIIALIPIVKWILFVVALFISIIIFTDSDALENICFNKEKFMSNKVLNFLFNHNYDKNDFKKKKLEKKKEKFAKDKIHYITGL